MCDNESKTDNNSNKQDSKKPLSSYALVLEGGAMRGVFTSGVLDWLMDKSIYCPYVVGVSAGACNAASYVSKQRGRTKRCTIDLLEKYDYLGFKHFIKQHNFLDFDMLFDKVPNHYIPFDFDAFAKTDLRFEMVTSSCITGEAEYHEEYENHQRLLDLLRASSSMPLLSPIVWVDGVPMLDGGVCDSIPAQRAIEVGYEKLIIVLTRNKGYRTKDSSLLRVPSWIYKEYPHLREAINNRNKIYNEQLDFVDRLEAQGKAIVIRPQEPITIKRIDKDTAKLTHFYNHGYECAQNMLSELI